MNRQQRREAERRGAQVPPPLTAAEFVNGSLSVVGSEIAGALRALIECDALALTDAQRAAAEEHAGEYMTSWCTEHGVVLPPLDQALAILAEHEQG